MAEWRWCKVGWGGGGGMVVVGGCGNSGCGGVDL